MFCFQHQHVFLCGVHVATTTHTHVQTKTSFNRSGARKKNKPKGRVCKPACEKRVRDQHSKAQTEAASMSALYMNMCRPAYLAGRSYRAWKMGMVLGLVVVRAAVCLCVARRPPVEDNLRCRHLKCHARKKRVCCMTLAVANVTRAHINLKSQNLLLDDVEAKQSGRPDRGSGRQMPLVSTTQP